MSATVISVADSVAAVTAEVEFAACDCCGLTEECTPAYIARVRERHGGRWICGLCAEAVKDEICRSGLLLSPEEAVGRHASFCRSFRTSASSEPSVDPAERLIAAVRQLFRRSLDSPSSGPVNPEQPPVQWGGRVPGRAGPDRQWLPHTARLRSIEEKSYDIEWQEEKRNREKKMEHDFSREKKNHCSNSRL